MYSVASGYVRDTPQPVPHHARAKISAMDVILAAATATCNPRGGRFRELAGADINWNEVIRLAERHGLIPVLNRQIVESADSVPEFAVERVGAAFRENARRALWLSHLLAKILRCLESRGVAALPYKGAVLAQMLFENGTLRQFSDLDILVRTRDLPRAQAALREAGFTPQLTLTPSQEAAYIDSGYEMVFDWGHHKNLVELQWRILPRFYAIDFDMDRLFQRATTVTVGGQHMKTVCAQDLLPVLCVHAAKHVWGKLSWIVDIAQLARSPQIDWDELVVDAGRLGISRIVAVSFFLCQELLATPMPRQIRGLFATEKRGANLGRQVAANLARQIEPDVRSAEYFRTVARLRERWSDKARFLTRLALTPSLNEWSAISLPGPLFKMYPLVRLGRLLQKLAVQRF